MNQWQRPPRMWYAFTKYDRNRSLYAARGVSYLGFNEGSWRQGWVDNLARSGGRDVLNFRNEDIMWEDEEFPEDCSIFDGADQFLGARGSP